jgi:hypothetical protein
VQRQEAARRADAAERLAVGAEQLARRARVLPAGQPLARRVHARVREGGPQPLGVGGQPARAVQRLLRERVLVLEAGRAERLEPRRIAPRPGALPFVEELVDLHPREG